MGEYSRYSKEEGAGDVQADGQAGKSGRLTHIVLVELVHAVSAVDADKSLKVMV